MILLMAMEQARAWIICGELDFGAGLRVDEQNIFDDAMDAPGRYFPATIERRTQALQLETMPVQMHRMVVHALINELQSVAPSLR